MQDQDEHNIPVSYPAKSLPSLPCPPPLANASNASSDRSWDVVAPAYTHPLQSQSHNVPPVLASIAIRASGECWNTQVQPAPPRYALPHRTTFLPQTAPPPYPSLSA